MNIHLDNGTTEQVLLNSIDNITYTNATSIDLPVVSTLSVTNISAGSAEAGGNVTDDSGTPVTQRGLCWDTSPNPSLADNLTIEGSGLGVFSSVMYGLSPNMSYYVRAYAINGYGVAYGTELTFTTTSGETEIVSIPGQGVIFDGYNYPSVILGNNQEWLAENLRTTVYANGDPIPNIQSEGEWMNLEYGAWVHYINNGIYEVPYGKMYNWYAVNDSRNICPIGWHVPSNDEWDALEDYLGGVFDSGGKMKATGFEYWNEPNFGATNESGFSGLPGGVRGPSGFTDVGQSGFWWSSTETTIFAAQCYSLRHWDGNIGDYSFFNKEFGVSVRCLKDD